MREFFVRMLLRVIRPAFDRWLAEQLRTGGAIWKASHHSSQDFIGESEAMGRRTGSLVRREMVRSVATRDDGSSVWSIAKDGTLTINPGASSPSASRPDPRGAS